MKRMPMTNIVRDSEGDVFSTRTGSLRLVLGGKQTRGTPDRKSASWFRGRHHTELTVVPIHSNLQVIYADLGVYAGPLGTPCDVM